MDYGYINLNSFSTDTVFLASSCASSEADIIHYFDHTWKINYIGPILIKRLYFFDELSLCFFLPTFEVEVASVIVFILEQIT